MIAEGPSPVRAEGTLSTDQYWQAWTPETVRGAVVLVHGAHEHAGRYQHVAERFAASGFATYAVDHPGHGRSPGRRGNITSLAATVDGVAELVGLAGRRHPGVPLFVYGHSLGGLIALQYLTGTPDERIRGAVLSAPALDTAAASGAQRLLAPLLSKLMPNLGVLKLEPEAISRDAEVVVDYVLDPLNHTGRMRARTGTEIMLGAAAMPERLASLTLPLMVIHGSADRLMPPAASELVHEYATDSDVSLRIYPGLYHEPHNEPEQNQVLNEVVGWLGVQAEG